MNVQAWMQSKGEAPAASTGVSSDIGGQVKSRGIWDVTSLRLTNPSRRGADSGTDLSGEKQSSFCLCCVTFRWGLPAHCREDRVLLLWSPAPSSLLGCLFHPLPASRWVCSSCEQKPSSPKSLLSATASSGANMLAPVLQGEILFQCKSWPDKNIDAMS